jgi:hypothetical protein
MEQPPSFKKYTVDPITDLPVRRWEPGLSAVPEKWFGKELNAALITLGFNVDRPENLRTGLLTADWNGHLASALVVATSIHRQPSEPFAVSEQAS